MGLFDRLFGRRRDESPAAKWLARRAKAEPEEVIQEHFRAVVAHDLDWILATLTPERARLYNSPNTLDRKRLSVRDARVIGIAPAPEAGIDPVPGYGEQQGYRVDFELELAADRRDPTLVAGRQWAYYLLVRERPGQPWMIADWGR